MGAVDEIFGAVLTGVIVDAWLFGLVCVLTYHYYLNFPSDRKGTKLLVAWMGLLQFFNAIVVSKMVYYYLVTSFGKGENLTVAVWEWSLYLGLSSTSAFSVQAYYARRTYLLTKSYLLFFIILSLAVVQFGFGLATMSEAFHLVILAKFTSVTWVAVVWLAFAAGCDLIIAATQVVFLHRHRTGIASYANNLILTIHSGNLSPFTSTNRLVNILILYIVSTGLFTSIIAILELTTFAILGFNFVHVFLSNVMGAIYAVSFLANLDARRIVRAITQDPGTITLRNLQSSCNSGSTLNILFKNIIGSKSVVSPCPSSDTTAKFSSDSNSKIECLSKFENV